MTPTMNAGGVPSAAPIPVPGSYGLPVLGRVLDTLDFLFVSGWTEFFAKRQRKYRSNVFKVNCFAHHRAAGSPRDLALVQVRASGAGLRLQLGRTAAPMVGNVSPSIFEAGDAHDVRKCSICGSAAFVDARCGVQRGCRGFITRWAALGIQWRDELEDFAVSFCFSGCSANVPTQGCPFSIQQHFPAYVSRHHQAHPGRNIVGPSY